MQYKPLTADELNFTYKMYKTPKECCFIFNVSSILSIILACFESTSLRSCRCDANSLIFPRMLSNNCNVSIENANSNYKLPEAHKDRMLLAKLSKTFAIFPSFIRLFLF